MKVISCPNVLALIFFALASNVYAEHAAMNPVTRVVQLMEAMVKKIEAESKIEEGLYKKFVCWATTTIDTKDASNVAVQADIVKTTNFINDIEQGAIDFTTEEKDLEKEKKDLIADIDATTNQREKENSEYLRAADEMDKAIKALNTASNTLTWATEENTGTSFVAMSTNADLISSAVELCQRFLNEGDALFVRRILTGDVPEVDFKKLNRKATFKSKYKTRSVKIQALLKDMLATFRTNLEDSHTKEGEAKKTFDKLIGEKNKQKLNLEDALRDLVEENGARGMNLEQAKAELESLQEQKKNDEKFILQTTADLATKKEEWKERLKLRSLEQEAIAQAIAILRSDDARDTMTKSFKSQGFTLLQENMSSQTLRKRNAAVSELRRIAQSSKDPRLSLLASRMQAGRSHFEEVVSAIDLMLKALKKDAGRDLGKKETCETNRLKDLGIATVASRNIDEMEGKINHWKSEIKQIENEQKEKQKTIDETKKSLAEATGNRNDENAEWRKSDADDADAVGLIETAVGVLTTFYEKLANNELTLAQVPAGQAPVPPPPTWEQPYGGKKQESTGVIAILVMIKEDIEKDAVKAKTAESESLGAYNEFKTTSDKDIKDLGDDIIRLDGEKSGKEGDIQGETTIQGAAKNTVRTTVEKIKSDAANGCDYFIINFDVRTKNRQIERDGLVKAKAILEGGDFN